MLNGIDVNQIETLNFDGTEFDIGIIKNKHKFKLIENINVVDAQEGNVKISADQMIKTFVLGVKAIRNFKIGEEVKSLSGDEINEDLFDLIDFDIIKDITAKIMNLNFVNEEERKN